MQPGVSPPCGCRIHPISLWLSGRTAGQTQNWDNLGQRAGIEGDCGQREQGQPGRKESRQEGEGARAGPLSLLHDAGRGPGGRDGLGAPHRLHHRRGRQGRSSSRRTSRSRSPGRCWPPTWWPRSTSAARPGTPERERSVRKLIGRVVDTITRWGQRGRLLRHRGGPRRLPRRADAPAAPPEGGLQLARSGSTSASRSTRSARPASSTRSTTRWSRILGLAKTEGMLFKYGSGTGSQPLAHPLLARSCSPAAAPPPARSPS